MKTLYIAGLVLSLLVVGCSGNGGQSQTVTITPLTPTAVAAEPTNTVVTPSLPCFTRLTDQRAAIIAELDKVGGRVKLDTVEIWNDGGCPRGTMDWGRANEYVTNHPDATPSELGSTPETEFVELEGSWQIPDGSLQGSVYWVSATLPTRAVCGVLQLTCLE